MTEDAVGAVETVEPPITPGNGAGTPEGEAC